MIDGFLPAMAAMFGIGLLGVGHCVGMCGGIASALSFADQKGATHLIVAYNVGRIFSYGCAGAIISSLGYVGSHYLELAPILRGIAGVLLISMGLYLAGWWQGLTWLERAGLVLWKRLQPLAQRLLPVRSLGSAMTLGLMWGWLPCGLVYTALAYAATAASPLMGMAQMVAFGLGTLPAMVLGGVAMGGLAGVLQSRNFRRLFALLLIAYGIWTLVPVFLFHEHY
ncbi:MAG: sulfite exporter TauE/SafE family protein [Gammaproteobacteria bacterium]|nr:MAG: sulfite exporter TauE/SafE family protein [Gammaproteobacteria bacterium]